MYNFDILRELVYDVIYILSVCISKKYVVLLIKYAKKIEKSQEVDLTMATVKNLWPVRFGIRWPQNLSSIHYYKAEEY